MTVSQQTLTAAQELMRATELWAALVGAMFGGLIGLLGQLVALSAARRDRKEQRKNVERALATSLLLKVTRIVANVLHIQNHIEESVARAATESVSGELWQALWPIANPPEAINLTSDEMALVLSSKDRIVFNAVLSMDTEHNGLLATLRLYSDYRRDLLARLPAPQDLRGASVGTSKLSLKEKLALQPAIDEVASLAEQLRSDAKRNAHEFRHALSALQTLLKKQLNLGYELFISVNRRT